MEVVERKWMTKPEACKRLQLTDRRVEQLVTEGRLEARKMPNPQGGKDVLMLQRASVERYAALKHAERRMGSSAALVKQAMQMEQLQARLVAEPPGPIESPADWLTLQQASAYTKGLSAELLLDLIHQARLPGNPGGRACRTNYDSGRGIIPLDLFARGRQKEVHCKGIHRVEIRGISTMKRGLQERSGATASSGPLTSVR